VPYSSRLIFDSKEEIFLDIQLEKEVILERQKKTDIQTLTTKQKIEQIKKKK